MKHLARVMMAVAATTPVAASAYVGTPFITPAMPTSQTAISVHVPAGICHAFLDQTDEAELTLMSPGQLRLLVDGVALPPGHPFCNAPEFTYRFDIGTLAAGNYDLHVFIRDDFSLPEPTEFGSVSFVVGMPVSVSTMSTWARLMSLALLFTTGCAAVRLRTRCS